MIGLGTIVNSLAIIIGGIVGLIFKKGIPEKIKNQILIILGVSVSLMGVLTLVEKSLIIENNTVSTRGLMMPIVSLVLGVIVGEVINIEEKFDKLGFWLRKATNNTKDNKFVDGFITASLLFCVGAMGILGSIQDGITGDTTILYTKSVLDGITMVIFASTYGVGAIFSALSVFVYQGIITLLSFAINDYVTAEIMNSISIVGAIMIFCLGTNIFAGTKFRVGNMLPALIFAIIFTMINIF